MFCFVDVSTLWFRCKSVPLPHFTKTFTFFCRCKKIKVLSLIHQIEVPENMTLQTICTLARQNLRVGEPTVVQEEVAICKPRGLRFETGAHACLWLYYTVCTLQGLRLCVSDCTTQCIAVCRALDCVSESCKPAVYHRQNCNRQNAEEDALSVAEFNITLHHTAVLCIRVYHIDVHRVDFPLGCVLHRSTLYHKMSIVCIFVLVVYHTDALWLTQLYTGFTILQLFRFYPASVCNSFLWSSLIVQLFPAPTLSAALLQFSGGKEHTFSFALIGHYIIQRGQYPPCFLPWSSFFRQKSFVTNCALCWTGTTSCGTERRSGGVDKWARIGRIKASALNPLSLSLFLSLSLSLSELVCLAKVLCMMNFVKVRGRAHIT